MPEKPQKPHRDAAVAAEPAEGPEVAQSVDISGKGDPCSFTGNGYALQWSYERGTDTVEFVMRQKPKAGQWWSAVGIGDNMSVGDVNWVDKIELIENNKLK